MELFVIGLIAFIAVTGVVLAAMVFSQHSQKGWEQALQTSQEVRRLLTARVTTVENRLMSHHWQDFANLQMVPDETAKAAWQSPHTDPRPPESYGLTEEEMVTAHMQAQGVDLEGEDFGPIIG